jgi:hypothetical protein
MRRFFTLVALLLFALPLGLSTTGCVTQVADYCNSAGYGPLTTSIYAVKIAASQSDVGISLAYGQEGQVLTPTVQNCKGATLSAGAPTYGSSNLNLVDISPTGGVCGGTWNRLSAGGIPDFTICTPPTAPGTATVTASVGGVVSNPVTVYVHPQISAITLSAPTGCVVSGADGPNLISETSVFGQDGENLTPTSATNVIGTITYTANTASIVTINNTSVNAAAGVSLTGTTNGTTTANQPGGTVLTATIAGNATNSAGTSSAAGYFYTCPPASVALSLPSSSNATSTNGDTIISAGNPQTITSVLTSTVPTGTGGSPVSIVPTSGASPDYTSTRPTQITVSAAGLVSSTFPGTATITGICQPGVATSSTTTAATVSSTTTGESCNPTPLNVLGTFGTGLPIVGNPIVVQSPGTENTLLWAASPNSQYFTPFDLSLSTSGSPVLLPYVPNSMVLDPTGSDLYFGSYREVMVYSATTNAIVAQDTTVPGVVLAVSPANNQVVIADQLRQVIYLYTPAAPSSTAGGATTVSSSTSIGGLAIHAAYSQDGKNVYVVGPTTLFVHNVVSGWSQYPLANANATTSCTLNNDGTTPFCSPDLAISVPSVAVFLTGSTVNARSFCPDTTASPVDYNPVAATVSGDAADHLAATSDGNHILGANTTTLFDIEGNTPTRLIAPIGPCPGVVSAAGALPIATTLKQLALTNITPTQIDQVLASPDSSKAFITYTATTASGLLPMYTPSATTGAAGTLTNIQLAAGALAPIAGVFSPDSTQFFVSTTGDNLIHEIDAGTSADTLELNPLLTDSNGGAVPAQFLVSKPRPTT